MIKKTIIILTLFIIFTGTVQGFVPENSVEKNVYGYSFKPNDKVIFAQKADTNLNLWEKSQNKEDKSFYLQEALRYYFLLLKVDKTSVKAHVGLGKVYDEMNLDGFAKEHFYDAYNIDVNNPDLNICFGDFYYKRNNLVNALKYYRTAYYNGRSGNYNLNKRIAVIYEKLADIDKSKTFYIKAQKLNPNDVELENKINLLDSLKYSETQYYLFNQ